MQAVRAEVIRICFGVVVDASNDTFSSFQRYTFLPLRAFRATRCKSPLMKTMCLFLCWLQGCGACHGVFKGLIASILNIWLDLWQGLCMYLHLDIYGAS